MEKQHDYLLFNKAVPLDKRGSMVGCAGFEPATEIFYLIDYK
ncbi:hypothetical protein [Symbiopectobacterium sp. RP]